MRTHLLVALAFASVAYAQNTCVYSPDNQASVGTCNVIPFGTTPTDPTWNNQKYQHFVPASTVGNLPMMIRELAFAPCGTGPHSFRTIKITMGQTTAAMSTTFAQNLGANPVVVLDSSNYRWNTTANSWSRIGLERSFLYIPALGDVVIDIEVQGAGSASAMGFHRGTLARLYAIGWTGQPPLSGSIDMAATKIELCSDLADAQAFGEGCRGQQPAPANIGASNLPRINTTNFSIDLSNGAPSRPAFLILGGQALPPFPIDLGLIGLPGCRLFCSTDVLVGGGTDATGRRSLNLPIANDPTLLGVRLFAQFFVLDAAGSLQGSDYLRVLVGT